MPVVPDQPPVDTYLLPSLVIGIPSVDREHDELLAQLSALMNDPGAHPDTEAFSAILSQLGNQLSDHFIHEERILKSCGMPSDEVRAHIDAHASIVKQYVQMNLNLMRGTSLSRAEVLVTVKDWIVGHVVSFDLNLKNYLPAANEATPD